MWLWKCLATVVFLLCLMSNVILESINESVFVCPIYLMWYQLHSRQYRRLLLWQVPLVIVLWDVLLFKFLILPDWEIFAQYLQVFGLLNPLIRVVVGWVILALTSMSLREGGFL